MHSDARDIIITIIFPEDGSGPKTQKDEMFKAVVVVERSSAWREVVTIFLCILFAF